MAGSQPARRPLCILATASALAIAAALTTMPAPSFAQVIGGNGAIYGSDGNDGGGGGGGWGVGGSGGSGANGGGPGSIGAGGSGAGFAGGGAGVGGGGGGDPNNGSSGNGTISDLTNTGTITGGAGGSIKGGGGGAGIGGGGGASFGAGAGGDAGFTINNSTITNTDSGIISGGNGGVGSTSGGSGGAGIGGGGAGGGGGGGGAGLNGLTIVNSGTIRGGNGGNGGLSNGAGGAGISGSNMTVVNSGKISGGVNGDGTTRANAISFTGGANTLTLQNGSAITGNIAISTGTLTFDQSTAQTLSNTITGAGAVINGGAGTLTLTGTNTYTSGTTLTLGELSVSSNANLGAALGALTFNGGTLQVTGTSFTSTTRTINWGANGGGLDIADADNTFTVDQSLGGAGGLTKTGAGTLVLSAANNTYAGATTISAGTLQGGAANAFSAASATTVNALGVLDLGGFAQTINQVSLAGGFVGNGALTGAITSSGGIVKNLGGSASLTTTSGTTSVLGTNAYTGTTTINGGTLLVSGAMVNSALTANNGGTLTGNGIVGNTTLNSGATINPGLSGTGTLHVTGSFTQEAGSTYQVVADPASNASNAIVVTGAADIGGATLNVTKTTPGVAWQLGAEYTVLTASGGVTGTYDLTGDTALSGFASLMADYADPNSVVLDVKQTRLLTDVSGTFNQASTAAGLQSLPDNSPLLSALVLGLPSDAGARAAFDQLSGEIHPSIAGQMVEDSRFVRDAALDRLTDAFCGVGHGGDANRPDASGVTSSGSCAVNPDRVTAWGHAFGSWGNFGSDGNAASMSRTIGGFIAGLDAPVHDDWRAGILAGYSQSNFSVNGRGSSGTSNDYTVGLYGGRQWDALSLKLGAAYTWHDIDTTRDIAIPGINVGAPKASYHAGTAQAFGELGYRFRLGGLDLEPFANLAYVNQQVDSFQETGGEAALRARSQDQNVGFSTLGLHAATSFMLGSIPVTAKATLGWQHAFGDVELSTSFNFAGGTPFTVSGLPIAKDAAVVDTGLDFQMTPGTTLGVSYDGQFGKNATDQSVHGTLAMKF